MEGILKRPMLLLCLAYVLGIAAWGSGLPGWRVFLVAVILAIAAAAARRSYYISILIAAIGLLGAGRCALFLHPGPNDVSRFASGKIVRLSGTVCEDSIINGRRLKTVVRASSVEINGKTNPVSGRVAVSIYLPSETGAKLPDFGDEVSFSGFLREPADFWNPNDFSWKRHLAAQRIFAVISASLQKSGLEINENSGENPLSRAVHRLRHNLLDYIYEKYPGSAGKTIVGILLGVTTDLPAEDRIAFTRSGTYHLLAASGFNCLAIVIVLGRYLFPLLGIHKRFNCLLVIGSLIFYAMLSGGRPSIIRAALMASLFLVSFLLKRSGDSLNILAASALTLLLVNPGDFFNLSFQLSFAAAGSIILFMPLVRAYTGSRPTNSPMRTIGYIRNEALGAALATTVVIFGTAPITAQAFNQVSLVAVPANALVALLTLVVFVLAPAALLLGVLPVIGGCLAVVGTIPANLLLSVVRFFGSFEYSSISIKSPNPLSILGYYLLLCAGMWWASNGFPLAKKANVRPSITAAAGAVTLLVWIWALWPVQTGLKAVFLDVGQGDCVLVQTPGGYTVLVDSGPDTPYDTAAAFLRNQGINNVDLLVLTHPHSDHIGEAQCILNNFRVRRIISPFPLSETGLKSKRAQYFIAKASMVVRFPDKCQLDILAPAEEASVADAVNDNEQSLVAKVQYGESDILLCGDAGMESEMGMIARGADLEAEVVKIGHHGSYTAASSQFLDKVKPKYAVISVGKYNSYGHPSQDTIARLEQRNIKVFRTDYHSAITVKSDGKAIQVIPARKNIPAK